jgi:hypothetical protein
MPEKLLGATLLICDRVLREEDGVLSVIRLVDIFYITLIAEQPPEKQGVQITVLVQLKARPEDQSEHSLQLFITRPDGKTKAVSDPIPAPLKSSIPGAPGGFNVQAQIGVAAPQIGIHYLSLFVDGVENAKTAFTLLERKPDTNS